MLTLPHGISAERLVTAIQFSRKSLEPFRRERRLAVRQFVGAHYSDDGPAEKVPVNLIALYISIMSRSLVAKNPSVMLSTFDAQQKPVVAAMEKWCAGEMEEMEFADELRDWVTDALFSVGILKVGLASPVESAMSRWNLPAGQPFVSTISLDDFVWDMYAKKPGECTFFGHRYRVPLEVAERILRNPGDEPFTPSVAQDNNADGDARLNVLGRGTRGTKEEFEDHVDLWEIELPRHKLVVTLRDDEGLPSAKNIVKIQPLIAPPGGHYHILGFGKVPDNLQPKSPIMDLVDLAGSINNTYRKLMAQTNRYKSVLPVRGAQMDTAGNVKQAVDGEIIEAENAETLKEIAFGGPAPILVEMATHLKDLFDFMGGNLALLGGRGPQSKTAAQDKMLNENASAGVQDMQDATVTGTAKVLKSLTWYWWNHPQKVMQSAYSARSTPEIEMVRNVTPDQRRGPMPSVKIDPYSLMHSTPQQRLQFMQGVVTAVTPMLQLLQQQGVMFNVNAYLSMIAKYGNEPDLVDIFQYQEPPAQDAAGGGQTEGPGMPANTTRTYERRSMGGEGSEGSKQQEVVNSMRERAAEQGAA